jgi:hypothetical protein
LEVGIEFNLGCVTYLHVSRQYEYGCPFRYG